MLTFFESLLLGHLIGDYILQNNWMAQRKGAHYFPCIVHCVLYTLAVCALTNWNLWWALVVFASHFPIDKWALANKWLKAYGGRATDVFLESGHRDVPDELTDVRRIAQYDNYITLRGGFTALVYVVVDNTFHLILMLIGAFYLKKYGLW